MASLEHTFINERGNKIHMKIQADSAELTVYASGPTSEVEHTWTFREALNLKGMLSQAIDDVLKETMTPE